MLVLRRLEGERIMIGEDIVVTLLSSNSKSVKFGIDAPEHLPIVREELVKTVKENKES